MATPNEGVQRQETLDLLPGSSAEPEEVLRTAAAGGKTAPSTAPTPRPAPEPREPEPYLRLSPAPDPDAHATAADRRPLPERVHEALALANRSVQGYRRWDLALTCVTIVGGTVATVLAGGAAIGGSGVAEIVGSWEKTCLIVTIASVLSTAASSFARQFQVSDTYTRCASYRRELLKLSDALASGNSHDLEKKFQDIQAKYINLR